MQSWVDRGRALRKTVGRMIAGDSYVNRAANLGGGAMGMATNLLAAGTYEFDRITLNQMLLRAAYRGSWIVAMACDAIAEDMTARGVEFGTKIPPDYAAALNDQADALELWPQIADWLRWGRLFGGAILVPIIDGHDPSQPLRPETIRAGQLAGFDVFDRWRLTPDVANRVQTPGRWRGFPAYYSTLADGQGTPSMRIHHSRLFRFDASPLPHWERVGNSMWGMSIIERIFPNVRAFDSTTTGASQLATKSHLRTLKIKDYWNIFGGNSIAAANLQKRIDELRLMQSSESLTVLDMDETLEHFTQTFAGLDGLLQQLGQQVWGAIGIPEVRALRKSASGLNASDEWALNSYYDDIHTRQKNTLQQPIRRLYDLLARNATGAGLPDGVEFEFRHLSRPNPERRAQVAATLAGAVMQVYDSGLIGPKTALAELQQTSAETGLFTNISDADIEAAENAPPRGELPDDPPDSPVGTL